MKIMDFFTRKTV